MGIIVRFWTPVALRRSCCFEDLSSRMSYYALNLRRRSDFCKNRECPAYCRVIKTPRPRFSKLNFTLYCRALPTTTKSESVNVDSGICIFSSQSDSRVLTLCYGVTGINSDLGRPKHDLNSTGFQLETASWFYL